MTAEPGTVAITEDVLQGSWLLFGWEQRYDDGRVLQPFGANPVGTISYCGDRMTCMFSRAGRPPFSAGQWNSTPEEKVQAYDDVLAYAGSFEVVDGTVVHHVDVSLYPNWVGRPQVRRPALTDDQLTLTARLEEGTDQARSAVLIFRRHRQDAETSRNRVP